MSGPRGAAWGQSVPLREGPGDELGRKEEEGVDVEQEHGSSHNEEEGIDGESDLVCSLVVKDQ